MYLDRSAWYPCRYRILSLGFATRFAINRHGRLKRGDNGWHWLDVVKPGLKRRLTCCLDFQWMMEGRQSAAVHLPNVAREHPDVGIGDEALEAVILQYALVTIEEAGADRRY